MTDFARIDDFDKVVQATAEYILRKRLDNIYADINAGHLAAHLESIGHKRTMSVVYAAIDRVRASPLPVAELVPLFRELDEET